MFFSSSPSNPRLQDTLADQCLVVREVAERARINAENAKQDIKFMVDKSKTALSLISKSLICDVEWQDENSPRNF